MADKFKLSIIGPGKDPQISVGACVAESAVDDFLKNPSESGLEGIIIEKRDDARPAEAIKHHLDTKLSDAHAPVDLKRFVTIGGYDLLTTADVMMICADAGTDYIRRYHAGVPPSAEDSFAVNNEIILGVEDRFKGIARELADAKYRGSVGVITNPSDYIAHLLQARLFELLKETDPERAEFLSERIWGFSPEEPRLAWGISEYLSQLDIQARPDQIEAHSCGPHDVRDFFVPVLSMTQIEGYSEAGMTAILERLFEGRHTIKEKLKGYGGWLLKLENNTSREVGIYSQNPIKMMAGVKSKAPLSKLIKLSDRNNLERLLPDLKEMDKDEMKKVFDAFVNQEGLNERVREYAEKHADSIINFKESLNEDPGSFLSLPYEMFKGAIRIQKGFRLNQKRFDEQLQLLVSYMKCMGFGKDYVLPFSKGQRPEIKRSRWSSYQKMVGSRYIIADKIGDGGQGIVLHAKDPYDNYREFALKIYKDLARTELSKDWDRFYRQVRIQTQLDHPNIIRCYGMATGLKGYPGLLLEFVSHPDHGDKDLREIFIDGVHKADYSKINDIFLAIGSALREIHSHRTSETNRPWYVHRDVKPKNFLLTHVDGKDVVKLGDFGAAAVIPEVSLTGKDTMMMGTLSYLPPEGIAKDGKVPLKQVTPAMDTYSAGVSLYELAARVKPKRDEQGNFEGGKENLEYVPIVLLKGNSEFEYYDRLVRRCLDPAWEEGKTKRPIDGEEFLYEVIIASNYALVKAYEAAVKSAIDKAGENFTLGVSDIVNLQNARKALYAALTATEGEGKPAKEGSASALYKIPEEKLAAHLHKPNCIIHSAVQSDDSLEGKCKTRAISFVENVNKKGVTPETRATAEQYRAILGSFVKRG